MVTIVDYNTGNIGSIQNILRKAGEDSVITSDKKEISRATKLVLPGVGSFDTGMRNLVRLDLVDILNIKALEEKIPVLGICLGMQLMAKKSEEGNLPGLGWINAEVRKFNFQDTNKFKIPHMGWNFITLEKESAIFSGMYDNARFYFVHSYYFSASDNSDILASTTYGFKFTSAIENGNIIGIQFHPEKSHKFGMKLLQNFVAYN